MDINKHKKIIMKTSVHDKNFSNFKCYDIIIIF